MKILVIDDHPLIHEALAHVLFELDPALELIQAHDSNDTHAALARAPDTDLIVLDLALPGTFASRMAGDSGGRVIGDARPRDCGSGAR